MNMKKLDVYSYRGYTDEDNKAILKHVDEEIDMFIDEYDRVWNEGGQYIADAYEVDPDDGIGWEHL